MHLPGGSAEGGDHVGRMAIVGLLATEKRAGGVAPERLVDVRIGGSGLTLRKRRQKPLDHACAGRRFVLEFEVPDHLEDQRVEIGDHRVHVGETLPSRPGRAGPSLRGPRWSARVTEARAETLPTGAIWPIGDPMTR